MTWAPCIIFILFSFSIFEYSISMRIFTGTWYPNDSRFSSADFTTEEPKILFFEICMFLTFEQYLFISFHSPILSSIDLLEFDKTICLSFSKDL